MAFTTVKGELVMADYDFISFIYNIKQKTGLDLTQYREEQLKRRLTTLYRKNGYENFGHYFTGIEHDVSMFNELLDNMTINVTEFFRNPPLWEKVRQHILPQLMRKKSRIKSWSAGCSTGEEPYTLAMIFQELNIDKEYILATDVDLEALSKAKQGIFTERALQRMHKYFQEKYFIKQQKSYEISETIKKLVQFKKQNLLADHFDTNYDFITCRNVMIYFTEEAREQLYQKFSESLNPEGVLFVGNNEKIPQPERYGLVTEDSFFYKKM